MNDPRLFSATEICLGNASRMAARAVRRVYNRQMRPLDINHPQFGLLVALARSPRNNIRELADKMALDASTLTRNIAVLERRGAVSSDGGRGRAGKVFRLTPEGEELLGRALNAWEAAHDVLTQEFPQYRARNRIRHHIILSHSP